MKRSDFFFFLFGVCNLGSTKADSVAAEKQETLALNDIYQQYQSETHSEL